MEKTPSRETGFPIEAQASEIYTNEIFRKFQIELSSRTFYQCNELAAGRQYQVKRIATEAYKHEEFNRSIFTVEVDDEKENYSCTCKKMTRDGIQCCHVLKVLDHTGMILQLPKSFINPRWTKKVAKSMKELATSEERSIEGQGEESMRFSLVFTEMVNICSNACKKQKAYNVLQDYVRDMKSRVMIALAEEENDENERTEAASKTDFDTTLKNPPMKESKRAMKEYRKKSGSEKKIGKKIRRRCGCCKKEDHISPSCPTNPAVIEKNRLQEEAERRRKTLRDIKANRNCPTT